MLATGPRTRNHKARLTIVASFESSSSGQMSKSVGALIEKPALQSCRRSLMDRFPYLYVLPATIMFVGFVAYPILWVVGESFRGADGRTYVGLEQYARAFSDPVFWRVLWNMFLWGAITIPAQMVIGTQQIPFRAHAWVEVDGSVVNDKPYTPEMYAVLDRC